MEQSLPASRELIPDALAQRQRLRRMGCEQPRSRNRNVSRVRTPPSTGTREIRSAVRQAPAHWVRAPASTHDEQLLDLLFYTS